MRVIPLSLALLACADADLATEAPFDVEQVSAEEVLGADSGVGSLRSGLLLDAPALVARGTTVEIAVSGLAPNEVAQVFYSTAGVGRGPCPASMGGTCFEIVNPLQLGNTTPADASGVGRVQAPVGPNVPNGTSVAVQAVAIRGLGGVQTVTSDPHEARVQRTRSDVYNHFPPSIDLLFVIDNSGSMAEEQTKLGNSFATLLPILGDFALDYHVGVITTDMSDREMSGRLQTDNGGDKYLTPSDANQPVAFVQMANVGTTGSGDEDGFSAMVASVNDHGAGYNAGFRRDDAQYAVAVLSDDDDNSTFVSVGDARNFLLGQETWNDDSTFTSIVTPQGGCPTGARYGEQYLALTDLVGGAEGSICANNYGPALVAMSNLWWTSEPFELTRPPIEPESIAIEVDGVAVDPADFVYDAEQNTVRFTNSFAPPAGAGVEVVYFF